jgi:hypothetical protein
MKHIRLEAGLFLVQRICWSWYPSSGKRCCSISKDSYYSYQQVCKEREKWLLGTFIRLYSLLSLCLLTVALCRPALISSCVLDGGCRGRVKRNQHRRGLSHRRRFDRIVSGVVEDQLSFRGCPEDPRPGAQANHAGILPLDLNAGMQRGV